MWNKENEFCLTFIFWISSVSKFLQLMKFSGFFLFDPTVKSLNWLNNNLRFGAGLCVKYTIVIGIFSHRGFIHLKVLMNKLMKILIVDVSKRKRFTSTFKVKPVVAVFANNLLKIQKI